MQNQKVSCNFNSTSYHSLSLFLSTTTSLPSSSFFPSSPSSLFPSPHCVPSFLSPPTTAVPHHSPSCRRCLQTFDEICAIAQCRLQWHYLTQLPHCAASLYAPSSPAPLPLPRCALTKLSVANAKFPYFLLKCLQSFCVCHRVLEQLLRLLLSSSATGAALCHSRSPFTRIPLLPLVSPVAVLLWQNA